MKFALLALISVAQSLSTENKETVNVSAEGFGGFRPGNAANDTIGSIDFGIGSGTWECTEENKNTDRCRFSYRPEAVRPSRPSRPSPPRGLKATPKSTIREIGAYRDTGRRALRKGPHRYGYDAKKCQAACPKYRYFALQNNGWCSCDNDFKHVTKYGRSRCGKRGGGWCNYVYENLRARKPAPRPPRAVRRIRAIGAFRDTGRRALRHGPHKYGFDARKCQAACPTYRYFALQNNGWCSCDNDFKHVTKYGKSRCGKRGGGWCNYVYESVGGVAATPAQSGFRGEFFYMRKRTNNRGYRTAGRKPNAVVYSKTLNFPNDKAFTKLAKGFPSNYFAAQWTAKFKVARAGWYYFTTSSDDGSRIWVDGRKVADNWGRHPRRSRSGRIHLRAGVHAFKATFFENNGAANLKVTYRGRDTGNRNRVLTAL